MGPQVSRPRHLRPRQCPTNTCNGTNAMTSTLPTSALDKPSHKCRTRVAWGADLDAIMTHDTTPCAPEQVAGAFDVLMATARILIETKGSPWRIPDWCSGTRYVHEADAEPGPAIRSGPRIPCHRVDVLQTASTDANARAGMVELVTNTIVRRQCAGRACPIFNRGLRKPNDVLNRVTTKPYDRLMLMAACLIDDYLGDRSEQALRNKSPIETNDSLNTLDEKTMRDFTDSEANTCIRYLVRNLPPDSFEHASSNLLVELATLLGVETKSNLSNERHAVFDAETESHLRRFLSRSPLVWPRYSLGTVKYCSSRDIISAIIPSRPYVPYHVRLALAARAANAADSILKYRLQKQDSLLQIRARVVPSWQSRI